MREHMNKSKCDDAHLNALDSDKEQNMFGYWVKGEGFLEGSRDRRGNLITVIKFLHNHISIKSIENRNGGEGEQESIGTDKSQSEEAENSGCEAAQSIDKVAYTKIVAFHILFFLLNKACQIDVLHHSKKNKRKAYKS
jgi:hypothetical protein